MGIDWILLPIMQEAVKNMETGPKKIKETLTKKASPVSQKRRDLKVRCPKCAASLEPELQSVELVSDSLNKFGRRELNYVAHAKEFLEWIPASKKFRCLICRETFTLKELALQ